MRRPIVYRSPDDLRPYARNARVHSKKQIRQIAASIRRFGFTNPVLIDEGDTILAGHGRVEAAKLIGIAEVPCMVASGYTEAEKRAYIIADNKLAQNAGWDDEILAIELQFLVSEAPDIDIGVTGFEISEIDAILEAGSASEDRDPVDQNVEEPNRDKPAITQLGDMWLLGAHRLLCGDARHAASYRQVLTSTSGAFEPAVMVFTDPPYNVRIDGNAMGSGAIRHREFVMGSGEMSRSDFQSFLAQVFEQLAINSVDGSIHFVCMDWRHMAEIQSAGEQHFRELKNLIVWVKDNGGMGTFYRSRHELIFVWKNGDAPHLNTFGLGKSGRYRTNVWNYRGISSGGREARQSLELHPTVKLVATVADAMRDCSQRGGVVLDPFCGSGTVLIAAQRVGRRARAIELDPHYCDVAILRWQAFAHDEAILAATGETFAQVVERRLSTLQVEQNVPEVTVTAPRRTKSPWSAINEGRDDAQA